MKVLILAGGSGERFWPLSTPKTPKQFLKIFGDKTLLRRTFERIYPPIDPKDIYIVTLGKYVEKTKREIPEIPVENIIAEPLKRNTAPAIILSLLRMNGHDIVSVLPADHMIPNKEDFWKVLDKASCVADKYGGIVTIGIKPTRPETGYGYIEIAFEIEKEVYKVKRFREKPDYETAMSFIEKGNFYWNSGMFIFKVNEFLKEAKKYAKEIVNKLLTIDLEDEEEVKKAYENMEPISVDYAIMEKSEKVLMIKSDFYWSDVGNWISVREIEGYSKNNDNIALIDSENIFIKGVTKNIAVVGLKDVIIVEAEEGLLIMNELYAPKVREAVKKFYK